MLCRDHGNYMPARQLQIFYDETNIEVSNDYCPNCEGSLTPSELEKRLLEIGDSVLKTWFSSLKNPPKATRVEIL